MLSLRTVGRPAFSVGCLHKLVRPWENPSGSERSPPGLWAELLLFEGSLIFGYLRNPPVIVILSERMRVEGSTH